MPQCQVMSGWNVKEEGDRGDGLIGMAWAATRKERGAFRRNVSSPFRSTPSGPLDRTSSAGGIPLLPCRKKAKPTGTLSAPRHCHLCQSRMASWRALSVARGDALLASPGRVEGRPNTAPSTRMVPMIPPTAAPSYIRRCDNLMALAAAAMASRATTAR